MNPQINLRSLTASKPFGRTKAVLTTIVRPFALIGGALVVLGIVLLMRFAGRETR